MRIAIYHARTEVWSCAALLLLLKQSYIKQREVDGSEESIIKPTLIAFVDWHFT